MVFRAILFASILLILAPLAQTVHSAAPRGRDYELEICFDIPRSKITGAGRLAVLRGERRRFGVGRLAIRSVEVNRKPIHFQIHAGALTVTAPESGVLEIHYEGVFEPGRSRAAGSGVGAIGPEGIFLRSGWYPQSYGPGFYRLEATLPRGYVAVSEAERIDKIESRGGVMFGFQFNHPVDEISFVATNRYRITRERFHGIELAAYFFPEDQHLAPSYLSYAKKYLQLYEKLLLPFPFKRFAIVENFLPTGISMPTYTLLGREVVRLPFIVETSLGHEILHQWFGNQVYAGEQGNWAEGLTTYLADHLYAEKKGEGSSYRKQLLVDYRSYVHEDNDFPLASFTARLDAASRSIGYGKAAMVFHTLRQMLGNEPFFGALRIFLRDKSFQHASWTDLKNAFQRQSGKELGWFFDQWLERKGLPELHLNGFAVSENAGRFALDFDLSQPGEIYRLDVPVDVLYRAGGEQKTRIRLEEKKKHVRIDLEKEPSEVVIDGNYDLARRLVEAEVPPVVASLIGAENRIVALPPRDQSRYQEIIDTFRAKGAKVKAAESLSDEELRSAVLILLGTDNPVVRRLYGHVETAARGFNLAVKNNPWNPALSVGIFSARSAAETSAALPKIFHYGKYSSLAFDRGRNVIAAVAPSERGIRKDLGEDPPAVDLSTLSTLSAVVEKLARKKIVYVGEEHDKFAHHQVQLEVLRSLYRQTPKIAVGMEMFQRPSQQALDDYVAGAIDERAFLKQSEYFKQWSIDYHLYKPILDFARAHRLPVVALNLRREIVDKVAKSGLDSLSKEEKREIPQKLDLSDREYRGRLTEVFARHREFKQENFDFFYQAQVLWDETMAESIDGFLKQHPDYRMIVLAGAGHLQYGSGIPRRAFRRNQSAHAIILNDAEVEKGIADFIVFPPASKAPAAPRLGVSLDPGNHGLRVTGFSQPSAAQNAGVKIGDAIAKLDDHPVFGIEDVRIALFYKQPGETIKVAAKRGDREMEFNVRLR